MAGGVVERSGFGADVGCSAQERRLGGEVDADGLGDGIVVVVVVVVRWEREVVDSVAQFAGERLEGVGGLSARTRGFRWPVLGGGWHIGAAGMVNLVMDAVPWRGYGLQVKRERLPGRYAIVVERHDRCVAACLRV